MGYRAWRQQQDYANIFQYKARNITYSSLPNGAKGDGKIPFYNDVYTLKGKENTYYLATYEAKMGISEYVNGVQIFSIEKDTLNQGVKLIKTKSGLRSRLEYNFVWTEEHPDNIIFDKITGILKLPVILENGKANGSYITYKFTGKYFEKVKN